MNHQQDILHDICIALCFRIHLLVPQIDGLEAGINIYLIAGTRIWSLNIFLPCHFSLTSLARTTFFHWESYPWFPCCFESKQAKRQEKSLVLCHLIGKSSKFIGASWNLWALVRTKSFVCTFLHVFQVGNVLCKMFEVFVTARERERESWSKVFRILVQASSLYFPCLAEMFEGTKKSSWNYQPFSSVSLDCSLMQAFLLVFFWLH